jgi:hypothetical protein
MRGEGSQVGLEELRFENYGQNEMCNRAEWPDVGEGILFTDAE